MTNPYLEKLRSIGYVKRGSKPIVKEYRHPDEGYRIKETTDELNNTVTQHAKGDRQDVHLRPKPVELVLAVNSNKIEKKD